MCNRKTAQREMKIRNVRRSFHLIAAAILLAGLGSAVLIYLTADSYSERVLGYEMVGGSVYPITPQDSKKYRHDLEVYGGKANVLADEFISWFNGLWRGKSLAFTVACITVFVSFGFFLVGSHLSSDSESDVRDEGNRAGTG
jgi:hypothetical protein